MAARPRCSASGQDEPDLWPGQRRRSQRGARLTALLPTARLAPVRRLRVAIPALVLFRAPAWQPASDHRIARRRDGSRANFIGIRRLASDHVQQPRQCGARLQRWSIVPCRCAGSIAGQRIGRRGVCDDGRPGNRKRGSRWVETDQAVGRGTCWINSASRLVMACISAVFVDWLCRVAVSSADVPPALSAPGRPAAATGASRPRDPRPQEPSPRVRRSRDRPFAHRPAVTLEPAARPPARPHGRVEPASRTRILRHGSLTLRRGNLARPDVLGRLDRRDWHLGGVRLIHARSALVRHR